MASAFAPVVCPSFSFGHEQDTRAVVRLDIRAVEASDRHRNRLRALLAGVAVVLDGEDHLGLAIAATGRLDNLVHSHARSQCDGGAVQVGYLIDAVWDAWNKDWWRRLLPLAVDPSASEARPMLQASPSRSVVILALAATLVVSCTASSQPTATPAAPVRELVQQADGYVIASRFDDLVFTSGFLGVAPGEDFEADVVDALDRVEVALEASGAGFDTLLKMNVYLTDWDNWETFNAIYEERIGEFGLPPRTTVEIVRLGLDAPIEIAAIAHVRTSAP